MITSENEGLARVFGDNPRSGYGLYSIEDEHSDPRLSLTLSGMRSNARRGLTLAVQRQPHQQYHDALTTPPQVPLAQLESL